MANVAKKGEALCPLCRESSPVSAVVCPHCKAVWTQAQIEARNQAASVAGESAKDDKKATVVGCVGIIGVILLLATCIGSEDKKQADDASTVASTGDAKADAIGIYKAVIAATSDCDKSSAKLAGALKGQDMVFAYRAADQAQTYCLGTGSALRKIEVPDSIKGEPRKSISDALEACSTAYVMKWDGAKKLKAVIDGDRSPSALAELQETTETMQHGQLLCGGGLVAAATALGATTADLGLEDGDAK